VGAQRGQQGPLQAQAELNAHAHCPCRTSVCAKILRENHAKQFSQLAFAGFVQAELLLNRSVIFIHFVYFFIG
jgi:hypothetical protein